MVRRCRRKEMRMEHCSKDADAGSPDAAESLAVYSGSMPLRGDVDFVLGTKRSVSNGKWALIASEEHTRLLVIEELYNDLMAHITAHEFS